MDRFDCMRAFVETVRNNGFGAAARVLDLPRSSVSKQIQALEESIGVQLMVRTTRSLRLTDAGSSYFEAAVDLLASLDEAEQRARDGELRGILRVNAPVSFALRRLTPLLPRFHQLHPQIELQLVLSDYLEDPVSSGFDVTLRVAKLTDSSLESRFLAPAPRMLVASPGYIQRRGHPSHPDDLTSHSLLGYSYLQSGVQITLTRNTEVKRIQTTGPMHANNGDLLARLAELGVGIALLPEFIAEEGLSSGKLIHLLPDWAPPPISLHAIYPKHARTPQKTSSFIDFLATELSGPTSD